MKKKNKIAIGLVGLATTGVVAGAVGGVVSANQQTSIVANQTDNTVNNDNTNNNVNTENTANNNVNTGNTTNNNVNVENTNVSNTETNTNTSTGNTNSSSNDVNTTVDFSSAFNAKLTRIAARSTEATDQYVLTVSENTKKEGAIFIIDEKGEMQSQMVVKPGQLVKLGVVFNEGYEDYTVRDLTVYGANPNYTVPTQQVTGPANQFTFTLPTIEEQQDKMTGENMFYGNGNSEIKVIPSFIISSIGENVNWQHGAFFQTINGYVFNMDKDMKWSDLINYIVNGQFDNEDPTNPINIFVYMNGHTLTVNSDSTIKLPAVSKKGWAVHFYNNSTDSKDQTNGYGKIVPEENTDADFDAQGQMSVEGTIALGRGVQYNTIQWKGGLKFLDLNDKSWLGGIVNNPEENK